MKRPLLWALSLLIIGIMLTRAQCEAPFYLILPVLLVPTPFVFKNMKVADVILIICLYSTGVVNGLQVFAPSDHLQAFFDKDVELSGTVEGLPEQEADRTQFIIQIVSPEPVSKTRLKVFVPEAVESIQIGHQITVSGRFALPERARNPGGFDQWLYFKAEGIEGRLIVSSSDQIKVTGQRRSLKDVPVRWHQKLCLICDQTFTSIQSSLIKGVVLGERSMEKTVEEAFQKAGVSHVLSVSGLHVTVLYSALLLLMKKKGVKRRFRLAIAAPFLIFYILMTGARPSVIRASVMLMVMILGESLQENYDSLSTLCLAAAGILIQSPAQLYSAGFQLSFLAVLGILILNRPLCYRYEMLFNRKPGMVASSLILTLSATAATLPAMLFHFHSVSFAGFLSNLLIVPLTGLLIFLAVPAMAVLWLLPSVSQIALPAAFCADLMTNLAHFFSGAGGLVLNCGSLSILEGISLFVPLLVAAGYFSFKGKKRRRMIGLIFLGVLVITAGINLWPKPFTITFLDVGQGDAALIETPSGKAYLIDGGGYMNTGRQDQISKRQSISEKVLLPALYAKNIHRLEGVFISHHHADHCQGIEELLKTFPVKAVYITAKYGSVQALAPSGVPIEVLGQGDYFKSADGMKIDILWPNHQKEDVSEDDQNHFSMVMRVSFGACDFLFTGDIEDGDEAALIDELSPVEVLKTGHHGSKTSSSEEFLEKLKPSVAVISVGRYNTFGHPSPKTLEKLDQSGAKYLRTDRHGAVEIQTDGCDFKVKTRLGSDELKGNAE